MVDGGRMAEESSSYILRRTVLPTCALLIRLTGSQRSKRQYQGQRVSLNEVGEGETIEDDLGWEAMGSIATRAGGHDRSRKCVSISEEEKGLGEKEAGAIQDG